MSDASSESPASENDSSSDAEVVDAELVDAEAADNKEGTDSPFSTDGGDEPAEPTNNPSSEEVLSDMVTSLEEVTAQRDEYLDLARRVQAEFENYRRRVDGQRVEQAQRAAESLVVELLPVLDACESALAHGSEDVAPIQGTLLGILHKQGLAKLDEVDVLFDPTVHEAVLTEEGDDSEPTVVEVLRSGYSWHSRVVRPAMVKVRG